MNPDCTIKRHRATIRCRSLLEDRQEHDVDDRRVAGEYVVEIIAPSYATDESLESLALDVFR